jgi:hypothetical protein
MALVAAVFSSMFCLAQQDLQVVPKVAPAASAVVPVKPVQATPHAAEAVPPAAPAAPQAKQAPCKPKPEKTVARKKFPTGSGHEPI